MKKLYSLIVAMFLIVGAFAQTPPYTDNFESYTVGGYLAAQNPDWWTTWSNTPGTGEDAIISNAHANSGAQSVLVDETGGSTDLILKLGNKTVGLYYIGWYVFVDNGKAGYYNIQHFQSPGTEWAFEVYFNTNGSGTLKAGGNSITFSYPKATWFKVYHEIDLDNDQIKLYVNGTQVHQWPFSYQASSTTGTKQLGAVDFFAGAQTGETPQYWFDDISFELAPAPLYSQNFDSWAVGSYVAVNDPEWFTTWSNSPGTGEDALIDNAFSHSSSNSARVDETDGATDLILKLSNKTSGHYNLSWYMYIENGKAGYYNIQHFQSPGTEWAFEMYFKANGTGKLLEGNNTITFTYPQATWFKVEHDINIDNDWIKLYVNNVLIEEWPFSYQSGSTTGTNQLGAVDFFAGAEQGSGETPKYFFDDVVFMAYGAIPEANIEVDPTSLAAYLEPNSTITEQITITNSGSLDLSFDALVILNSGKMAGKATATPQPAVLTNAFAGPVLNGGAPSTDATAVLHYDGDNYSAIGWSSAPVTVTVAAMFPYTMTAPYAGMKINSVDVYINDLNSSGSNEMTVKIYGMGLTYEPGPLIYSQPFTPMGGGWEHIVLTTPVLVTGEDIWVGYQFTQNETGIYIPGTDAGPNHPYGDFLSTGVGWSHLSNNPSLLYNWNIRANLNGDPFNKWLTITPTSGTIAPAGSQILDVTFNSNNQPVGIYEGIVRIMSNDPDSPSVDVLCTLSVSVGINDMNKVAVLVYPNPAQDFINVAANQKITEIRIMNFAGLTLYKGNENHINISNLPKGIYYLQTITHEGISNIKFIKN
jgi:hypothetical protein